MPEQTMAQFDIDTVRRMVEGVRAQELQNRIEDGEGRHSSYNHDECRSSLVNKNLIDDELEKEWRYQRKKLDKHRSDQHATQRIAISPYRRQEPVEPK